MERRHILIEATDGTDVNFMGYTHSSIRQLLQGQSFTEAPPWVVELGLAVDQPQPETWWQAAWRILNTDIRDLWRTYIWPKKL